jgi:uncharacterized protein (DUF2344 family)
MELRKIIKKLNHKEEAKLYVYNLPQDLISLFAEKVDLEIVLSGHDVNPDYVLVFAENMVNIDEWKTKYDKILDREVKFWVAYPKKASKKYKSDLQRATIWDQFGSYGLEPVMQIAIDDDWSGMRFKHVSAIKNMTRTFAATDEGKKRISK